MKKILFLLILLTTLFNFVQAQKGSINLSAGPLVSFPLDRYNINGYKTGVGVEFTGEFNLSNKSALLFQAGFTNLPAESVPDTYQENLKILSLKIGYKYNIGSSGFYVNGLGGTDIEYKNDFSTISFTLGAGKRFTIKEKYFLDAGIDYIDGDTQRRLNFKVAFILF
ncbi:MAG: outer membrane beta-barrel protein [Bacteroidota bacterium]